MLRGMSQISFFQTEPALLSVTELNRMLRQLLESDYRLQDVWVGGEVSNLAAPASGHMYFSLRDESASLRCVMWRPHVARLGFELQDGDAVEVHGRISMYEAGGQVQLYADQARQAGEGALFQEFLRLKHALEKEGIFDPSRKQAIPAWPKRVGVVTSPAAAALRDVLQVLRRRYPLLEVILSPTAVQGEDAAPQITLAIERLAQIDALDVILVVRGGGSMEDLWAFNDEQVVRAIANCEVPIITGIGHETDIILSDFAADLRAPTPSAAAELATPDGEDLTHMVQQRRMKLSRTFADQLRSLRWQLEQLKDSLRRVSPHAQIQLAREQVDQLSLRCWRALQHDLRLKATAVDGLEKTLYMASPASILERGYAVVSKKVDDAIIRSISQVRSGDDLRIRLHDGTFDAKALSEGDAE